MSQHRLHVTEEIREADELEFDWNGSNGLPARDDVILTAVSIFEESGCLDEFEDDLPPPLIELNGNGTLEFAYENDRKELVVTVQCSGILTYIKLLEDQQTSMEGTIRLNLTKSGFEPDDFVELQELFRWLAWG